ncbi:hypothetical protein AAFF_G00364870 [Aldrovandia affinis]|uniref:Mitochondrial protein n=1 Tax=Aldrovandia affinis TaxID=143900 RepID=A0AAD7SHP8_9TELE|nr:hypothetical protein AAFF_G00364870 [Aldrovandia affinis]
MAAAGIIQPSDSPWVSPVMLVRKKDRSLRFCVDYRWLNDVTGKDSYPLWCIDDAINSVSSSTWFSVLDRRSSYCQTSFLGHVVSERGVSIDPAKVEAMEKWPSPMSTGEVHSFLGLASYYQRFIVGFANITRPLHQLTEKGQQFMWLPAS